MTSPSVSQTNTNLAPKISRPLFPTQAKWRCLIPSDITYINKYKPKMVRSIEISQLNTNQTKNSSFRGLRRAFADNKTAFSVRITDPKYKNFAQVAHHISSLLNSSNHYKKIDFICFDDRSLPLTPTQKVFESLTRLGRCKELYSLKIHFNCRPGAKNAILNCLSPQLRRLQKLKVLDLDNFSASFFAMGRASAHEDPNEPLFRLKYPSCLSSLALSFQAADSARPDLLSTFISNLKKCNQLNHLNLNVGSIPGNSDPSTAPIWAPLLKNAASSLKSLTFQAKFSKENMNGFLEDFSHLKNLTALDLLISSELSQDQFRQFISVFYGLLASFPNFKSLKLRVLSRNSSLFGLFGGNSNQSLPIEYHIAFPPLQSLTKLEELKIDFPPHADLELPHLQSLSQALQHLHSLKKLNLEFDSQKITPGGISIIADSFKNLKYLQDLRLMISGIKLESQSVEAVLSSLTNLPLENLHLHLGQTISPEEAMFASLPLEQFAQMGMDRNQMMSRIPPRKICEDEMVISKILFSLSSLKLLKNLKLNLATFKFSAQQIEQLSGAFQNMKQLSSLNIDLPESENLMSSFSSLSKMPELSSLSAVFPKVKIGDEEVRSLTLNIQACKTLQALNLKFEEADELTDDSIHYLSKGLKGLSLRELHLNFARNQVFSEEAVFGFIENLKPMKTMKKLNFEYYPSKNTERLGNFVNNMAEQSNWRSFTGFPIQYGVSGGLGSLGGFGGFGGSGDFGVSGGLGNLGLGGSGGLGNLGLGGSGGLRF